MQQHLLTLQALSGEVGMSNQLDEIARALFNGQLPPQWRRLSPDTLKSLGNWMVHFERRYRQVRVCVRACVRVCVRACACVCVRVCQGGGS
jgi:hypothetical protein